MIAGVIGFGASEILNGTTIDHHRAQKIMAEYLGIKRKSKDDKFMKANCYSKPPSYLPTQAQIASMCEKLRKERTEVRCERGQQTKTFDIKRYHVSMSKNTINGLIATHECSH